MATYKTTVDRALCIGAATCVAIAPKAFTLDGEAKAIVLPSMNEENDATVLEAARGCPVAAILIHDKNTGKQVFP